jgi:hypothetical protein
VRASRILLFAATAALLASCSTPEPLAPLPPGCIAFGVFGDGPYRIWEEARFRRVVQEVNRADIAWLFHIGDIFWYPCSDGHYAEMRAEMSTIQHPVAYTPGDNEWADCHTRIDGRYRPLERLAQLRRTFFADPARTNGGRPMRVVSQGAEPRYSEFVENVRWTRGGLVCATIHLVGSGNAGDPFPGRTAEDDSARVRRTAAATAWLEEAFAVAHADSLHAVILAMHADPGFGKSDTPGYGHFVSRLRELVLGFDGHVVLIHGDAHTFVVDHPLWDPLRPDPIDTFTRIETFGSPDIGWVRVVVDSTSGEIVRVEPRRVSRWWLW